MNIYSMLPEEPIWLSLLIAKLKILHSITLSVSPNFGMKDVALFFGGDVESVCILSGWGHETEGTVQ